MRFRNHQDCIGITEDLVVVVVIVRLHVRTPELRTEERRGRSILHGIECLAVPFPHDGHRTPLVIVLFRQKVVHEVVVRLGRSISGGIVTELFDYHAVVFVAASLIWHAEAGDIGRIVQSPSGIRMLHFENRLRGVLHPERNVGKRILLEIAIDFFQFLAGVQ